MHSVESLLRQPKLDSLGCIGAVEVGADGEVRDGPLVRLQAQHAVHVLRDKATHRTRTDALLCRGTHSNAQRDMRLVGGPGLELLGRHRRQGLTHRGGVIRRLVVNITGFEKALDRLNCVLSCAKYQQVRAFSDLYNRILSNKTVIGCKDILENKLFHTCAWS